MGRKKSVTENTAHDPIDGPEFHALRERFSNTSDLSLSPMVIDYQAAAKLVATEDDVGELAASIAFLVASEREITMELAAHAVQTELDMLGVLAEKMTTPELAKRLIARIRAVAYPPDFG